MNKESLLKSYLRYGISEKDVCKSRIGIKGEEVDEVAVIAPLHKASGYLNCGAKVTQLSFGYYPAYRIEKDGVSFTFITTQIGACNVAEIVVALGFSNCKKIIFTGSVGGLKPEYKVGDILIPNFSISGDGVCRFFQEDNVSNSDDFGKRYFPDTTLQNKLIDYMNCQKLTDYKMANIFSIDTIVAQFMHIDELLNLGSDVVEMETACVFKVSKIVGLDAVAIFNVSDNTFSKKSLLAGRSKEELVKHVYTEEVLVPKLTFGFIKSLVK